MGSDLGREGKKKSESFIMLHWKEIFEDGQRDEHGGGSKDSKNRGS